jgi:two-component sensor histidine kinase
MLISLALFHSTSLAAQNGETPSAATLTAEIQKCKPDTNQVNLLLQLSRFYINSKLDADSALIFARQALRLSETLGFSNPINASLLLTSGILYRKNQINEATLYLDRIINFARRQGDVRQEADTYFYMGKAISSQTPENIELKISYYNKARLLYKQLDVFGLELVIRARITRLLADQGKTDLAEKEYLEQLADAKRRGFTGVKTIYWGLGEIASARNDHGKALYYELALLELCEAAKNTRANQQWKNQIYQDLAGIYCNLKMYKESQDASDKVISLSKELKDYDMYYEHVGKIGDRLFHQAKYEEALAVFQQASKDVPPNNHNQYTTLNRLFGTCYVRMKQPAKAEPYFKAMREHWEKMNAYSSDGIVIEREQAGQYLIMGEFYLSIKKYDAAKDFLTQLNNMTLSPSSIGYKITALKLRVAADTATNDFKSAFFHLARYQKMEDSIEKINAGYKGARELSVADLMVKYQTEKKDQDLLLRQKSIDLLTKQQQIQEGKLVQAALQIQLEKQQRLQEAQLSALQAEKRDRDFKLVKYDAERKGTHIILLNKQSQIQAASLQHTKLIRNMTVSGLILTSIIIALLFRGYQMKKTNNNLLTIQKNEIDLKNQNLQKLVTEKEWLLRELHHRVKNNLQIVMSLLNIQSFYLEDAKALLAIRDTEQRVNSISLIHKKLYLGDNVALIRMADYVPDLVNDLKQSLATEHRIQFQLEINDISLDTSKAVPLGLILNEAITNSVKYAFPSDRTGTIMISLLETNEETLSMAIADDGIGLPKDFRDEMNGSLGMSMIKGLSGDIDGVCKITGTHGTSIIIEFPHETKLMC